MIHFVDNPWNFVAGEKLKVICDSTRRADAAVEQKFMQRHKEQ